MWQQVAVTICVAAAALFLGKYIFESLRAIVKARSGCGDGCTNCAFAEKPAKGAKLAEGRAPGAIIPLSDIRTLPHKNP